MFPITCIISLCSFAFITTSSFNKLGWKMIPCFKLIKWCPYPCLLDIVCLQLYQVTHVRYTLCIMFNINSPIMFVEDLSPFVNNIAKPMILIILSRLGPCNKKRSLGFIYLLCHAHSSQSICNGPSGNTSCFFHYL
jgi:hypothetical protein